MCSFRLDKFAKPLTGTTAGGARRKLAAAFDPFQRDLPIPPSRRRPRATKQLERVRDHDAARDGGHPARPHTPILGYNGLLPGADDQGPARARGPDPRRRNKGGRDLNVHLHGGVTQPQSTGTRTTPSRRARSGCTSTRTSPARRRSGTTTTRTARRRRTLFAGLAGVLHPRGPDDKQLDLPQGDYDVPLMIQDRSFNADGSFRYRFDLDRGFRGDTILVNGAVAPRMKVERRLYRLRFLNASNARPTSSSSATAAR